MTKSEDIKTAFVRLAPRVAHISMRTFGARREDVGDAIQQTYLRLMNRTAGTPIEDEEALRKYMIGGVRSYLFHQRERNRREVYDTSWLVWHDIADQRATNAEGELITREEAARLREAIQKLKEPYRSIFTLRVDEEMKLVDIARKLNIEPLSIGWQYKRGLLRLRKILQQMS